MEKLDDVIPSRILITLGETVIAYNALYLNADGKFYKALADGSSQPALGLAVEGGDADDEIRLQIMGETTSSGWAWATPGAKLYLSTTVSGAITDVEPVSNTQAVGYSLSATKIMFSPSFEEIGDYSTNAALTNVSGSLQDQIDALDFYTTAEVDTISGTLHDEIVGLFIPTDFYSTSEVDLMISTTSGTLQDEIDAIVIPTDFYSTGEVDTISGTLHDEIISETKLFGTDSWQITVSGTDLLFQQWVTDEWITRTTISGS